MVGAPVIVADRYIFVHVPKTGGQSITKVLGGKTQGISTHTPLRCVTHDRFAFGFVRNPWARMVSLYRFLCQKRFRATDSFDQDRVRRVGFGAWLMEDEFFMAEDRLPEGEPWIMRECWKGDGGADLPPMQRRPQLWWLDGCDFIGRFEAIKEDFQSACALAGIPGPTLPHINRTSGDDWRREYDDESIAFVARHFAPDIARFGYAFG